MSDKTDGYNSGAITQAIEAAQEVNKELRFWHRNSKDGVKTSAALQQSEKSLESLKAFKDGVPVGFSQAVNLDVMDEKGNLKFLEKHDKYAGFVIQEGAIHLQAGIK